MVSLMRNFLRKLIGKKPIYRVRAWRDNSYDYASYEFSRALINLDKQLGIAMMNAVKQTYSNGI